MVKNMKIKHFLIISFAFILLLMNILGLMSIFFMQRLANQSITFYESPHTVQIQVAEVRVIMENIAGEIKESLIYQDKQHTDHTTATIAEGLEDMNARIALVQQRFTGDKQLLADSDALVTKWLAEIENMRVLMESEQYEKAKIEFEEVYSPLEDSLGGAVLKISESSAVTTEGFYTSAKRSKILSVYVISGTVLLTIVLTFVCCSSIIKSITIPLKRIKDAADAMARGDLKQEVDFNGRNEFGQLAQSMKVTTQTLSGYVQNIDDILGRLAAGDMTAAVEMDYVGDFAPIKTSLKNIVDALNHTLIQIGECSQQVAGSAEQVSYTAQSLSQGSSEQAASVEELSASITEISEQVKNNAAYTAQTHTLVENVGNELERGNGQMQEMLDAMTNINSASDQIAKIIKTIEDIAFQTNILALNAAVEAARAGAAGKGFAVVADEVRSLAGKSAEAAKSTTALIQNSIQAVDHGSKIADSTAKTLASVVSGAERITTMVAQISASSEQQAASVLQVTSAVEQISQVVQTNSATAEESSAASQELSGQSLTMKSLVGQFRLRNMQNPLLPAPPVR